MKKDRQKLEDNLDLILQDYSNDNKIIEKVTNDLATKGISRGKVGGWFTQAIPLCYVSEVELCLFTKSFYSHTHEFKINPEDFFNEVELSSAELYHYNEKEKTSVILLHNVDQINEYQWLCTKETYQNIAKYFENGLITYNPNTQRQPLKRKVGDRIIEVININKKKVKEIVDEMVKGTFNTNAIILNVRHITGTEKIKYNANNRTLMIEIDDTTLCDVIDGFHRLGSMLKVVEQKPDTDRITSIYVYFVDEEKARSVIRQEAKATPIEEEWLNIIDSANVNMEVVKNINSKQRMNEMFNRIAKDNLEIRRENKLVTFETLSKVIEYVYDLKDEPFIKAQEVEEFLINLFNVVIGVNHEQFNEKLNETKENYYLADNNMFIGYTILGEELKKKYEGEWKNELIRILNSLDFSRSNPIWKSIGMENNINLSTIKKISNYFKSLV
jgi:hypothetical protein